MLVSVSGCSGPSTFCRSRSVSRCCCAASSCCPIIMERIRQVVHAGQRVGVLRPQHLLPQPQRLAVLPRGLLVLPHALERNRQVAHAGQRVGVLRTQSVSC